MDFIGVVFIILTAALFTVFEAYIIYKYSKNKKYGRIIENAVVSIILLLYLCYKDVVQLHVYDFITVFLILTVFGHTYIGEYCGIYHKSKKYDRFLHLFGSFTFSLFVYSVIESMVKPVSYSKIYVAIFVATLGIAIGVLFELIEFAFDKLAKFEKNQHGLADTDFDLLFNVIGAILAGVASIKLF
jgi:uncharacterized membrane protein YjdF